MYSRLSPASLKDIADLANIPNFSPSNWLKDWKASKSANPFFQSFFKDSNDFRLKFEIPNKEIQTKDTKKFNALYYRIMNFLQKCSSGIEMPALESYDAISANSILSSFCFNNVKIQKGTKYFKTLHKLFPQYHSEITTFELEYSRCFPLKKTGTATLVLSINPFDFMTLSLNTYKWKSCFMWDCGEHCDSPAALLNSPFALVAYIEGSKKWNFSCGNKKWREIFYVLPHHIVPVKGYPYQNLPLEEKILKILAEAQNLPFPFHKETLFPNESYKGNIHIRTNYAYDDLNTREVIPYYWDNYEEPSQTFFTLDGIPTCPCGRPLEYHNSSYCAEHTDLRACDSCGELLDPDSLVETKWGLVCQCCLEDQFNNCSECGELFPDEEIMYDEDYNPYCTKCYSSCSLRSKTRQSLHQLATALKINRKDKAQYEILHSTYC